MKNITKTIKQQQSHNSITRPCAIDRITGTGDNGKFGNTHTYHGVEMRELHTMMPYGVSSRPPVGTPCQTMMDGDEYGAILGVFDDNRPSTEVGELILYSLFKSMLKFDKDGNATISSNDIKMIAKSLYSIVCGTLTVNASTINLNGTVNVSGIGDLKAKIASIEGRLSSVESKV